MRSFPFFIRFFQSHRVLAESLALCHHAAKSLAWVSRNALYLAMSSFITTRSRARSVRISSWMNDGHGENCSFLSSSDSAVVSRKKTQDHQAGAVLLPIPQSEHRSANMATSMIWCVTPQQLHPPCNHTQPMSARDHTAIVHTFRGHLYLVEVLKHGAVHDPRIVEAPHCLRLRCS
jgi:hypothetical protein